ncbi:P-loop NTPase fold protein [Marinobacteraceae bacterium S3BR75-40.1]
MPNEVTNNNEVSSNHWEDDKLQRQKQAQLLTQFLKAEYRRGTSRFVLNINSPWGFGKTFFLDRWRKDLEAQHHLVLTFNAWENDYAKDPLMSFLYGIASHLQDRLEHLRTLESEELGVQAVANVRQTQEASLKFTQFIQEHGYKMMRTVVGWAGVQLPSGVNIPASTYQAEADRKAAVESLKEHLTGIVDAIRTHEEKAHGYFQAPMFIFIDELDRCRPDFTVELIEVIKHFCNVDGIYFVFGTDGEQLQASLSSLYGPEFKAEVYFNRIFSREIHLSRPDTFAFAQALVAEYGILKSGADFEYLVTATKKENGRPLEAFFYDFSWVADAFALDMRAQHQLAATFDVLLKTRSQDGDPTFSVAALVLILLWQRNKQVFKEIVSAPADYEQLEPLTEQFRKVGIFEENRQEQVLLPMSDGWKPGAVSLPEVISGYLSLLSADQRRISEIRGDGGQVYYFLAKIVEKAHPPGRNDPPEGIPTLRKMFDQITMSA